MVFRSCSDGADLCAVELGGRVDIDAMGRHMDVTVDIVLGNSLNDTFRAFDVYILKREVPCCLSVFACVEASSWAYLVG